LKNSNFFFGKAVFDSNRMMKEMEEEKEIGGKKAKLCHDSLRES
jgi:hypothetical protein